MHRSFRFHVLSNLDVLRTSGTPPPPLEMPPSFCLYVAPSLTLGRRYSSSRCKTSLLCRGQSGVDPTLPKRYTYIHQRNALTNKRKPFCEKGQRVGGRSDVVNFRQTPEILWGVFLLVHIELELLSCKLSSRTSIPVAFSCVRSVVHDSCFYFLLCVGHYALLGLLGLSSLLYGAL